MGRSLAPGLYILCYHDINWAESAHIRGLGICHPPDRFSEHLDLYSELGEILGFNEALERVHSGNIQRPIFTLTFDDGYRGVMKHAYPALSDLDTTGMLAINHGFLGGRSTFWRSQLCWIRQEGGLAQLASRLEKHGYRSGSVRDFTMDHFHEDILELIFEIYEQFAGERRDRDMERLHLSLEDIVSLRNCGWEIANHSARHLPVLEKSASYTISQEYESCESELHALVSAPTRYWVAPFDRPLHRSEAALADFRKAAGTRSVVLVDDRRTDLASVTDQVIYRVFPPVSGPEQLYEQLRRADRRSKSLAPHLGLRK